MVRRSEESESGSSLLLRFPLSLCLIHCSFDSFQASLPFHPPNLRFPHFPILVLELVDYSFPENGLMAYHDGKQFHAQSFKDYLGEDKLKEFVNFCLHYIADLDIPKKRFDGRHSSANFPQLT